MKAYNIYFYNGQTKYKFGTETYKNIYVYYISLKKVPTNDF